MSETLSDLSPALLLEAHRRNWIWDLRSEKFIQTNGHLFSMVLDKRGEVINAGHCCIGVWCDRNIPGFRTHTQGSNFDNGGYYVVENEDDYERWMMALEIPVKLKQFLMSMNDGSSLYLYKAKGSQLDQYFVGGPGAGPKSASNRYIRADGAKREFPRIARFLEVVWGY